MAISFWVSDTSVFDWGEHSQLTIKLPSISEWFCSIWCTFVWNMNDQFFTCVNWMKDHHFSFLKLLKRNAIFMKFQITSSNLFLFEGCLCTSDFLVSLVDKTPEQIQNGARKFRFDHLILFLVLGSI